MGFLQTFPTDTLLVNILVLILAIGVILFLLRVFLHVAARFLAIGCFVIVVIGVLWLLFQLLK
jgi:hypothetical protein